MRALLLAFSITLLLSVPAPAQEILYSGTTGKKLGIRIIRDGVSEKDTDYVDRTYQLLKTYKLKKGETIGANDFYYRLKISVPTRFRTTSLECSASPFLLALAQSWFSYQEAALISVYASISYEPAIGGEIPIITSDKVPILMFSEGAAAGQLSTGHGCFLKQIVAREFPPIRFEGGNPADGKDVFHVSLDISSGSKLDAKLISGALALFSAAGSAAFPWSAAATAGLVKTFDDAINQAGSFQSETPITFTLKPRSTFYIRIPQAFSQRTIEVFPYLSASALLTSGKITPAAVLSSNDLAVKTCTFTEIASAACKSQPARLGVLESKFVTRITLPDKYQLPPSLFDPDSKPELTLKLCEALRLHLNETLRLSTVDEMLVRWALTKESGLQDNLKDPVIAKKILLAVQTNTPSATMEKIESTCWNSGDVAVLNAVTETTLKDH